MTMCKWGYSEVEILNVQPGYALKCGRPKNSIERMGIGEVAEPKAKLKNKS